MTAGKVACATAEQLKFRGTSNDPFMRAEKNRVFPQCFSFIINKLKDCAMYHPDI